MIRMTLSRPAAVAVLGLFLGLAPMCFVGNAAAARETPEGRQACTSDAFRLCDRFIPNRGRVAACLRHSRHLLSIDCRRTIFGR